MKRIFSLFLALVMVLLCFAGCSDETTNNDISTENNEGETSLLDENEFSDNSDDEVDVSVNEGEFDPLSIVKEEYITYDKGDTCHYYNGGGSPKLVFPENFEVEILPGLYLKRSSSNLTVYSNILNVISDNQLLGSIEYYFVGETLKYNDINKLSEGDVIKLMFREDDKSNDLNDNLVANGFSMVEIPMYITVPNLGELFTINDTITEEDLNSIVSVADPKNEFYYNDYLYSERPIVIYKGVAKSATVIGDAVVLKLIYERVTEKTGYTLKVALTTCELTKHSNGPATCTFEAVASDGFNVNVSEAEMIATWDDDYTWEKLDY